MNPTLPTLPGANNWPKIYETFGVEIVPKEPVSVKTDKVLGLSMRSNVAKEYVQFVGSTLNVKENVAAVVPTWVAEVLWVGSLGWVCADKLRFAVPSKLA